MEKRKQKKNSTLVILLALIVLVLAALWYLDRVGARAAAGEGAATEAAAEPAEPEDEAAAATVAREGMAAPDFEVEMLDGSKVTLASLRGKVVLLNFWATWCPPCREELTRVQAGIIDRFAGEEFVFLPVSRGEKRETVEKFLGEKGYGFAVGLDPEQEIYRLYATNFIPRNFLIGRDGKVVKAAVGYEEVEFAELADLIEETLKK